jgi:hypothetical protein
MIFRLFNHHAIPCDPQDVWLSESPDPKDMVQVAERIDYVGCRRRRWNTRDQDFVVE